ncbi:hypothetical protein CEXT_63211 [Caerostris extrusa]|uniref:Uncharacterized protein n=1 Tax=Caerostris extrusa TaxID=172846 RepID=A0AAV4U4Y5_CAEEX|nr:hypothetical protein CEXT_63211 [Caerostris extrusa]
MGLTLRRKRGDGLPLWVPIATRRQVGVVVGLGMSQSMSSKIIFGLEGLTFKCAKNTWKSKLFCTTMVIVEAWKSHRTYLLATIISVPFFSFEDNSMSWRGSESADWRNLSLNHGFDIIRAGSAHGISSKEPSYSICASRNQGVVSLACRRTQAAYVRSVAKNELRASTDEGGGVILLTQWIRAYILHCFCAFGY